MERERLGRPIRAALFLGFGLIVGIWLFAGYYFTRRIADVFALLLDRLRAPPTMKRAVAAGVVVAWAFLSDPYYAVYCQLMAVFAVAFAAVVIQDAPPERTRVGLRVFLDLALVCVGGLIAGIVLRGGGRFDVLGLRVSVTRLYTPVLLFTTLALVRIWTIARPKISWVLPVMVPQFRIVAVAGLACMTVLSPALYAVRSHWGEHEWIRPTVFWRSSAYERPVPQGVIARLQAHLRQRASRSAALYCFVTDSPSIMTSST
jgi:hypothetical protein